MAISAAIIIVHYWRLYRATRLAPHTTYFGRHRLARHSWVKEIVGSGDYILAVQTFRNWIMSATYMASIAILVAVGILGAAFTSNALEHFAQQLNLFGVKTQAYWLFKALVLLTDFMFIFFNFLLSLWAFNNCGFMVSLPRQKDKDTYTFATTLVDEVDRGALHFMLALRGFYFTIPLTLWIFGALWMLAGTLVLIFILRWVAYARPPSDPAPGAGLRELREV